MQIDNMKQLVKKYNINQNEYEFDYEHFLLKFIIKFISLHTNTTPILYALALYLTCVVYFQSDSIFLIKQVRPVKNYTH